MRIDAFLAEGRALAHAEAMLLVDDREAEAHEQDRLLDERVCADDNVDVARRKTIERLLPRGTGDAGGEQCHARSAALKERRE